MKTGILALAVAGLLFALPALSLAQQVPDAESGEPVEASPTMPPAKTSHAKAKHEKKAAVVREQSEQSEQSEQEAVEKQEAPEKTEAKEAKEEEHSTLHKIVFYLPNRVFDLLDIFRLRVRVGPGVAAGVRVTEPASIYVGTYGTIYVGLPGPRMRAMPKSPIGLETHNGASLGPAAVTFDAGFGPDYSPTEIGAGAQLALIGFDAGIDPVELVDFFTGLFLYHVRGEDF